MLRMTFFESPISFMALRISGNEAMTWRSPGEPETVARYEPPAAAATRSMAAPIASRIASPW